MNIKEVFAKAENGTLTLEQFNELAGNAKFTDLTEGNYVSVQKYNDEISGKDKQIATLNNTISQRQTDLEDLQQKLADAGTDATKLTDLQTKFDALQTQYTTDTQKYQEQLSKQKYEFAVKQFANTKKFTSKAAKEQFESKMLAQNLQMDGDKIIGAEDFVTSYSQDYTDSFVQPTEPAKPVEPAKPTFVAPTGTKPPINNDNPFGFNFPSLHGEKK